MGWPLMWIHFDWFELWAEFWLDWNNTTERKFNVIDIQLRENQTIRLECNRVHICSTLCSQWTSRISRQCFTLSWNRAQSLLWRLAFILVLWCHWIWSLGHIQILSQLPIGDFVVVLRSLFNLTCMILSFYVWKLKWKLS